MRGKGTKKGSGMDEVKGRGCRCQFFTDLYIFPSANPCRARIKLFGYRLWELGCLDATYPLLAAFIGIGGVAVWLGVSTQGVALLGLGHTKGRLWGNRPIIFNPE